MYSSFRNKILSLAPITGLNHQSALHSLSGPSGEQLYTDYFYTPQKKKKVLIHLCGVHGVEGYIGSAIQSQIFSQLKDVQHLPFQTVFVHAVNPYGMAWFHRTNANNVDLNRNGLKKYDLKNPHYALFKNFLSAGNTRTQIIEFIKALPAVLQIGIGETVKAVASGQSEFPDSLFFTGQELQPELLSLVKNLQELVGSDSELYVLDVHSGLGKFSQELLITDPDQGQKAVTFFESCFKTKLFNPSLEKNSYPAHGGMPNLLKQYWPSENVFHVFQEFGTRGLLSVLGALIQQNQFIRVKNHKNLEALKEKMLFNFFPDQKSWKEKCIESGRLRFHQIKQELTK
jgi:hypothetical protein